MKTLSKRSGVCLGVVALLALTATTACTEPERGDAAGDEGGSDPLRGRSAHPGHDLTA